MTSAIAITGMIANDSPAPGIAVARSLKAHPDCKGRRLVGLAYDVLESGNFLDGIMDDIFVVPYPSQGEEDFIKRLHYIKEQCGLSTLIPTLDAELLPLIKMQGRLKALGIAAFLPTLDQFQLRAKDRLGELETKHGLPVPRTRALQDVSEVYKLGGDFKFPLYIKGVFYEAALVYTENEAAEGFARVQARWGLPVIVQEAIVGDEFDVAALGDGTGRTIGAVPMRKMQLTDKGKAWAGVTVDDEKLIALTEKTIAALKWRGPLELEIMKSKKDGGLSILEINPRFPAWIYLAQGAGQNLPWACLRLAEGMSCPPFSAHRPGVLFIRAATDQVLPISDLDDLSMRGERHWKAAP